MKNINKLDKKITDIVLLAVGILALISALILANCGLYIYQVYSNKVFNIVGNILSASILETIVASVYYVIKTLYIQATTKPSS